MKENDYVTLVNIIRLYLSERKFEVGENYHIVSSLNSNGINELRGKLYEKGNSLLCKLSAKVMKMSHAFDLI